MQSHLELELEMRWPLLKQQPLLVRLEGSLSREVQALTTKFLQTVSNWCKENLTNDTLEDDGS